VNGSTHPNSWLSRRGIPQNRIISKRDCLGDLVVRVYTRRGGGFGASFGCLGFLVVAVARLFAWAIPLGLLAILFLLGVILIALTWSFWVVCLGVDRSLYVVPAYRKRRNADERTPWYKRPLDGVVGATFHQNKARAQASTPVPAARGSERTLGPTSTAASEAERMRIWQAKRSAAESMLCEMTDVEFAEMIGKILYTMNFTKVERLADRSVLLAIDRASGQCVVVDCIPFLGGADGRCRPTPRVGSPIGREGSEEACSGLNESVHTSGDEARRR
jgi:hypothetical protein